MKALNQWYEGNTQFCTEEIDGNRFYVERVYLDSPREDCNGYYSTIYGYPITDRGGEVRRKQNDKRRKIRNS